MPRKPLSSSRSIRYNKDLSKLSENDLAVAREAIDSETSDRDTLVLGGIKEHEGDGKVGHSTVGTTIPKRIRESHSHSFMN